MRVEELWEGVAAEWKSGLLADPWKALSQNAHPLLGEPWFDFAHTFSVDSGWKSSLQDRFPMGKQLFMLRDHECQALSGIECHCSCQAEARNPCSRFHIHPCETAALMGGLRKGHLLSWLSVYGGLIGFPPPLALLKSGLPSNGS